MDVPKMSIPATPENSAQPLTGLRVVCFESRRSAESSRMIARQGGDPVEAPSVREVPLRGAAGLDGLEADLQRGAELLLVLLTGVGTELLIEGLCQHLPREQALASLAAPSVKIVCRGPKPHAVLKQRGLKPALVVGEPNTWRDVLRELDAHDWVRGRAVYVQEYGRTNEELMAALGERAATSLSQVKTYTWSLPDDLAPLEAAIDRIAAGDAEVALFTSSVQITHLFEVAERLGARERLLAGLARLVVASVGPLTTEALASFGVHADVEPAHPKLGHLMLALCAEAPSKLLAKRGALRAS
jgi:uroporphyrinogen-III synthase